MPPMNGRALLSNKQGQHLGNLSLLYAISHLFKLFDFCSKHKMTVQKCFGVPLELNIIVTYCNIQI